MILSAYILNNLLLILYTIFGGIDFGIGILVIIFLLKKYDLKPLFKVFSPLWEVSNVILIFFVVTFYFFFPKAINFYSILFIIPTFLAFIFLFIRAGSYTLLSFYKGRIGIYYAFGISSILSCIFFSTYFLQFAQPIRDVSSLLSPSFFNIAFYLFIISSALNLTCGFIYALKDDSVFSEQIHNIYKINYIICFVLFLIISTYVYFQNNTMLSIYILIINIIVAIVSLFYILIFSRDKKSFSFIFSLSPILFALISILFSQYPYFSSFTNISVINSAASEGVLKVLFIVIILGILISIPSLTLFYKMFLKKEFEYE